MGIELNQLVDGLPALVWTALPNGEVDHVSQPWCDYTGETRRSLLGRGWCRALHPNDVPVWLRSWNPAAGAGAASWEFGARLRRSDGEYRRFLLRAAPVGEAADGAPSWCATAIDLEDRMRAEEAANRRRLDFEQIVDGLPAIMATFNARGNMDYCNRQMLAYLGETLAEIQAKDSGYNFHPDDRPEVLRAWAASVGSGQPFDGEARLGRGDGVYRWHRIRVLPLRNAADEVTMWHGLATDIDDARRAEAELSAEKHLLELVARGVAAPEALEAVCRHVEALAPGCACSIVRVDAGARTLEFGAAPSLPDDYKAMLDRRPVDPGEGAYSLTVETKTPIFIANLGADERWKASGWARLMGEIGFASCWSTPILSPAHEVMGVFAVYRPEPRGPTPSEQELIGRFGHIAGIAMERARADADLKQREAELARAYDFLNEAQRLSRTGSFTWDAHPEEQFWSDEMYRTLELAPGTLVTLEMARGVIHPDDLPIYDAMVARGQAGDVMEATYRIVTPSGAIKRLRTMAHRLTQVTDRAVYLGASQDVTDSELAEEALKAGAAELRAAYGLLTEVQRLSKVGSFSWDVLADRHHWSEEIYRVFGVDPATTANLALIQAAIHPDDMPAVEAVIARAYEGKPFEVAFRTVAPDGAIRHARVIAHRDEQIADRIVFIGALQDVTESKRAEEALDRAREELAHVSRMATLSTLTASIAHEVNQPLAGIITNANTCLRMLASDPPNLEGARATAQRTIRDGHRAADVITRLRALFSKRTPSREDVDLNDAAREVLALSAAELQRAQVKVRTSLADDLPPVVGDRVQLQQVILNLLRNAADAMMGVDDRERELVVGSARDGDGGVRLAVQDSGAGFGSANVEALFEPFHSTKDSGMGVGLSISRSIIESHDGRLWAEPNDGRGATFAFTLPVRPSVGPGDSDLAGSAG